MLESRKEFWVGLLVLASLGLILIFAWLMGLVGPFRKEVEFSVLYGFAGGVEVGSPVRVSGVKVGKVTAIDFLPAPHPEHQDATVKVDIGVSPKAIGLVKQDSKFFVNMAGIIGERYVEISPGSVDSAPLAAMATVRGIDPPRIDQLISQGYGVFGRVQDFLDRNEKNLTELLGSVSRLVTDANQVLKKSDKAKLSQLLSNLSGLAENLNAISIEARGSRGQKFVDQLFEMVDRAHQIDKEALRKFLQEEGVRARIF